MNGRRSLPHPHLHPFFPIWRPALFASFPSWSQGSPGSPLNSSVHLLATVPLFAPPYRPTCELIPEPVFATCTLPPSPQKFRSFLPAPRIKAMRCLLIDGELLLFGGPLVFPLDPPRRCHGSNLSHPANVKGHYLLPETPCHLPVPLKHPCRAALPPLLAPDSFTTFCVGEALCGTSRPLSPSHK